MRHELETTDQDIELEHYGASQELVLAPAPDGSGRISADRRVSLTIFVSEWCPVFKMIIRQAVEQDLDDILSVERAAFDSDETVNLVKDLMADASARPVVSLVACQAGRTIGHIVFSRAHLEQGSPVSVALLAPLAVAPDFQKQGVGGKLVKQGLQILSDSGVGLVFVLGWPDYYSRFGFRPAGKLGFDAPYPIPARNADAWMVQALAPDLIGTFSGKVICAESLNKPEYWYE